MQPGAVGEGRWVCGGLGELQSCVWPVQCLVIGLAPRGSHCRTFRVLLVLMISFQAHGLLSAEIWNRTASGSSYKPSWGHRGLCMCLCPHRMILPRPLLPLLAVLLFLVSGGLAVSLGSLWKQSKILFMLRCLSISGFFHPPIPDSVQRRGQPSGSLLPLLPEPFPFHQGSLLLSVGNGCLVLEHRVAALRGVG